MTCATCDWYSVATLSAGEFRTALQVGGFRWGTRAAQGGGRVMVVRHGSLALVRERLCPGSEAVLVRLARRALARRGVAVRLPMGKETT